MAGKSYNNMINKFNLLHDEDFEKIKYDEDGVFIKHTLCDNVSFIKKEYFNKTKYRRFVCSNRKCCTEKAKKTFLLNYGVDNPAKSSQIKLKTLVTNNLLYGGNSPSSDKSIFEKQQNTNLKKYGIKNVLQLQKNKDKNKTEEAIYKKYLTHKTNQSFNTSKPEELYYCNVLKNNFINIKRNYRSDLYPFRCDFYIEDMDIYLELNLHWTHGKEPFDINNISHLQILENWEQKAVTNKYYQNAIDTWTKRDVAKRNIAEQNNITLIELFDIKDIKEIKNNDIR